MINLIGAQLLSLPQGAKPATATQLAWPNGSILSARMVPGDSPGNVILMLGGYRFLAKVPANTPMGNIWLQLVNRELPAQFRLLSDFRAASLLARMLANRMKSQDQPGQEKSGGDQKSQQAARKKIEQGQPFQVETGSDGKRLMLRDPLDGSPRGVVNASSDEYSFLLHGRADLDHLGPVAFALEGSANQPWKLKLYAGSDSNISKLRPVFIQWLEEHADSEEFSSKLHIEGKLMGGLPERFETLGNLHG
ncbi:MAG: hypothetical protein ABUK11_06930 [Mariprofundaceae bacterium]